MASSLGAGLNSLVSGTKLLSAIAGDGTLPILRCFRAARASERELAGGLPAVAVVVRKHRVTPKSGVALVNGNLAKTKCCPYAGG